MSYRDFETRKSVHINLTRETHTAFKICSFKHKLSMQEIFEECARRVIEGDAYFIKMIESLETNKRKRAVKSMSKTDAESIFKVIEDENPLNN